MRRLVTIVTLIAAFGGIPVSAQEIGFVEDFALAKDRTNPLAQLIPGTEDYYYYHALYYQQTGQFDKVNELLSAWVKRYNETARYREIRHRQHLLTYNANPAESLEYLRQQLGLTFNHQRVTLGQKPNLPTQLDPRRISREVLLADAFARHRNLQGVEASALDWLVRGDLTDERRHHLLERLERPDHPNLPRLVVEDLNSRFNRGFGSLAIHRQLLLPQLEEVLRLKPDLLNQNNFVFTYLIKLQPNPDVDWRHDPQRKQAYLERLWSFVDRLGPVHNSLKVHVLYQRLQFDRQQGVYDKERFMTYIRLPRQVGYIAEEFLRQGDNRRFAANLSQDYGPQTLFPPVGADESLVRDYLQHFFVEETTLSAYEPYLDNTFLKHVFAETKIVNGLGDPEKWYSMLPPAQYQALKERVDLDFAFTNREVIGPDEPVGLDLFVKNVETLIVKVYEINTRNFYRRELREVNTDINLDGLVANEEITFNYSEPALRRVRRHFDFPSLNRRGVYVIDFIGNGKSSRAVIRKGKLHHLVRTSVAGHVFRVLDENRHLLPDARLWMAGRLYEPDEHGEIVVPFSNQPGRQPIVLSVGDFSSLDHFQHASENYQLTAGIYVDRESLLERQTTTVWVRPFLGLNGVPAPLSVLEDVRLILTSVDHDGVSTTKEVDNFELFEDQAASYDFDVPPRMARLTIQLLAKVKVLSRNETTDLKAEETFTLNQIDQTDNIVDLHLARFDGQFTVEVLGKSGEGRPNQAVSFRLKHRDFVQPAEVSLQSDEQGRIQLGRLEDIEQLTATGPANVTHTWPLDPENRRTYAPARHGVAGEPLSVPYMGSLETPDRSELSLLELRGETFVADRFEALAIEDGMLRIRDLPRGDYDLLLKPTNQRIRVRLSEGRRDLDHVLGGYRQLEVSYDQPLQIQKLDTSGESLTVQLLNAGPAARVHVIATRFEPEYSVFELLRNDPLAPGVRLFPDFESLYQAGRNIGDEYRYIIERRYAPTFPGNMLDRPELLLNPWAIRKTDTSLQRAAEGQPFGAEPEAPSAEVPKLSGGDEKRDGAVAGYSNLDFLGQPSTVLLNLEADEQGVVRVPKEKLGPHQSIHVVAVDPRATVYRSTSIAEQEADFRDVRLLAGLDPDKHFTQQKQISVVREGEAFTLGDISTSRFEVYDTLPRVYSLYATLSGDATLAEFAFVLRWPELTFEEKCEKYSKYACHELHFFIAKHDPAFFRGTVRPYLENKKNKTFLDRWLLGESLEEYRDPWRYQRLNIVERILLSQRIEAEREHTIRHVRQKFELLPPDIDRFNFLFNTAIQGQALDAGDRFGATELKSQLREDRAVQLGLDFRNQNGALPGMAGRSRRALGELADEEMAKRKAAAPPASKPAANAASEIAEKQSAAMDRAADKDFYFQRDALRRQAVQQLYRKLEKTQEWVENNYYKLPIEQQNADLVQVNAFWNDYAAHDPQEPFFSTHLARASHNFPEMMFAISLLDLPFKSPEHKTTFEGEKMTLQAAGPMVVYHEEIKPAESAEEQTPILVSQNFFRQGDRYSYVDNQKVDKYVTEEFLVHAVYGCQVVVTNPTSTRQKLDVLLQIPVGAIPVLKGQETRSAHIDLEPFHTQTLEYYFYFPAAGEFEHYPVHVAKNERLLASAEPVVFQVVRELSKVDRESWDYISQNGSDEDVLRFLRDNNLYRHDLSKIAFRMRDADFFQTVTQLLAERHAYDHTLWSYGIHHAAVPQIRQYLKHADGFVQQCGLWLDSPLLTIDPVARHLYQHREYHPLVNARTHQLGRRRRILNDRLHEQYHDLMQVLSYQPQLSDEDWMAVTYYVLLQDRIEEAMDFFARVNPEKLETQLQYDYFAAYLDFFTPDPTKAREIVARYDAYPVDRWRKAFAAVRSQLDELSGGDVELVDKDDRNQSQTKLAASQPQFDFQVEGGQVLLNYQNLDRVRVNYYLMDVELLFSRNPFVQQFSGQFSYIRPNEVQDLELPADRKMITFPLPEPLRNKNVLVEVVGGSDSRSVAYYSNSMALQLAQNYGQLQITSQDGGKPLPKVYVKVYAQMNDGQVRFFKDGYTDLRGRFDYTSLSTNELDNVRKFSLLVLSEQHGAVVREAEPPKR